MRRIHLLDRQLRDEGVHPFAEMWRECRVPEGLDEEDGDVDGRAVDEGELVVVVDLAGTVPVDCMVLGWMYNM